MPLFYQKPRLPETTETERFFLYRILRQVTTPQKVNKRNKQVQTPREDPNRYHVEVVNHHGCPCTLVLDRNTGLRRLYQGVYERNTAIQKFKG